MFYAFLFLLLFLSRKAVESVTSWDMLQFGFCGLRYGSTFGVVCCMMNARLSCRTDFANIATLYGGYVFKLWGLELEVPLPIGYQINLRAARKTPPPVEPNTRQDRLILK